MRYVLFCSVALFCTSCSRPIFKEKWTTEKAPSTFVTRFETSKGVFDVKITREWSPLAADRFYQQVKHRFYDSAIFYRVVPNFVAQFAGSDTGKTQAWQKYKIHDEEVLHGNVKGSISFARGGKESRGTSLFFNLRDNQRLDTLNYLGVKGFPSFGDVINGMDVVAALYSGYGEKPGGELKKYKTRREFLAAFPQLDIIWKVYILK